MNAIIAATISGIILMFASFMVKEKKNVVTIATLLMFLVLGVNIWDLATTSSNNPRSFFNNMLVMDRYSMWFSLMMTGVSCLYILLMGRDIAKVGSHVAEYFALIFFIMVGLYTLSGYNHMIMLFLGIEIISIPQYILAGSDKRNLKSSEASLKYFLMGAFSTGIFLMGITLLFGATGKFYILEFGSVLQPNNLNALALLGIIFIMIALSFKISAAPMHMWTPDVYDGSPTAFTAFMSTIAKAAAFIAFMRLFQSAFGSLGSHWVMVLAIITAATLFIGNLTAVFQQSVKRMLAYSSIAQAGFMLFAILSLQATAWQGIIIYSVAYSIASIGAFSVLIKLKDYTYDGFNGLAKKEPLVAFVMGVFLCSLAGIPLTGGFMAKYYVLQALVQQGQLMWLVIFGLLMAAVSVFYYFRVIIAMYFKPGTPELTAPISTADKLFLVLTCIIVFVIGIFPQLILGNI